MTYEDLLDEVDSEDILLIEMDFKGTSKGLYSDNVIALSNKLSTTAEKKSILVEELGHHHTSSGNILDLSALINRKQELRARNWGYAKSVGLLKLIEALRDGVRNRYELSEYLDVTEEYIEEAIKFYKTKYGLYHQVDNFVIYFEPLSVLEVWE